MMKSRIGSVWAGRWIQIVDVIGLVIDSMEGGDRPEIGW
jgi:hypothetical protein